MGLKADKKEDKTEYGWKIDGLDDYLNIENENDDFMESIAERAIAEYQSTLC